MAHDVFICYSPQDKPIADDICTHLEGAGLRCWIAPRDLPPGEEETHAIGKAIAQSGAVVLIFSVDSNPSEVITHQLYLAAHAGAAIVPFKIDDVIPIPAKRFYLGRTQWLEASRPPTPEQMEMLRERTHTASDEAKRARRIRQRTTATRWFIGIAVVGVIALAGLILNAETDLFKPEATPTNVAIRPTLMPTRTPTVTSPTPSPSIPAATTTPSLTATSTPTATRIPGVPVTNVTPGKTVFEETFSNPQFEGVLPPSFFPDCPGMAAAVRQKNGQLELGPSPNQGMCRIDFRISLQPQQFRYFEARFQFGDSLPDAQLPVGIGIDLVSPANPERLGMTCLHALAGFDCDVGYSIHEPIYRTPQQTTIKSNTWGFARIELTNPQTLQWTFLIDNKIVGSYQLPAEEAARWRTSTLEFYVFQYLLPASAQVAYLDDIAILAR